MSTTVNNTTAQAGRVTLFGELRDGRIVAKVMREDQVPYGAYWKEQVEQVMVYIEPTEDQLHSLLDALNERRLPFGHLQDYGGSGGGTSEFPV
jgi:hypothetical protein